MYRQDISDYPTARTVIPATNTVTAAPTSSTEGYVVDEDRNVTTFFSYTGTCSGTLRMWVADGTDWYKKGATVAFNSADGPTAVPWETDVSKFTFQVETITGTGSVTVKAR